MLSTKIPLQRGLLVSAHLASGAGLVGATLALLTLGAASVGGADPITIYPAAHLIAVWLLIPLSLVALGSGFLLALKGRWRLFAQWWLVMKLSIVAVLMSAAYFVLVPRLEKVATAAKGATLTEFAHAQRLPLLLAPGVATALLLLAVMLGVTKPGRGRSPEANPVLRSARPRSDEETPDISSRLAN